MIYSKESLIWPEWIRSICPELNKLSDEEIITLITQGRGPAGAHPNPLFNNSYYAMQVKLESSYPPIFDYIDKCSVAGRMKSPEAGLPDPNAFLSTGKYFKLASAIDSANGRHGSFPEISGSDAISHYLNLASDIYVQTSDRFSDFIFSQSQKKQTTNIKRPLQAFLESRIGEYAECSLASKSYAYPRRMAGRVLSAYGKDCILLSIPETITIKYPEFIPSLCKELRGKRLYLYVEAMIISSIDQILDVAEAIESRHQEVSITIGEKIGSFLGTWKNMTWAVPDLSQASSITYCAVSGEISNNLMRGLPGRIAKASVSDKAIKHVFSQNKLCALVYKHPDPDPVEAMEHIGSSDEFASSHEAINYLLDPLDSIESLRLDHVHDKDLAEGLFFPTAAYPSINSKFRPSIKGYIVSGPINQDQAYNLSNVQQPCLALPTAKPQQSAINASTKKTARVLAVIHCYYTDIAVDIFELLSARSQLFFVLATTDSHEKAAELSKHLVRLGLDYELAVTPNIGRDVAPMICESKRHFSNFEIMLHLHTKKSPQSRKLKGWREFLFQSLAGSGEIIDDCIELLTRDNTIGVLAAPHYSDLVCDSINWGFNKKLADDLLRRMDIIKSPAAVLDFPSSTMFWAKVDAIAPLFNIGLQYSDFGKEDGKTDGTLAHAIERIIYYVCESKSYTYLNVVGGLQNNCFSPVVINSSIKNVSRIVRDCFPRPSLACSQGFSTVYEEENQETYPTSLIFSDCKKRRFNLLVPSIEPSHVYGGIATALKVGMKIFNELGEGWTLRIVVTSAKVSIDGLIFIQSLFEGREMALIDSHCEDRTGVVDLLAQRDNCLSVKRNDVFFATAWWTADKALKIRHMASRRFSQMARVVYLIQDFECGFNAWSEKYALCQSTYQKGAHTIALINSEELTRFMLKRFSWNSCYCLPYEPNERILKSLKTVPKKPYIVVYARPAVQRNLFKVIVSALQIWQAANPSQARDYRIYFAGQDCSKSSISKIENAKLCGKLSLEDYAHLISEASLGISLMLSPHPSYPPLEMALAGMRVITNTYECKDLSQRNENIVNLREISIEELAKEIELQINVINEKLAGLDHQHTAKNNPLTAKVKNLPLHPSAIKFNADLVANEIVNDLA